MGSSALEAKAKALIQRLADGCERQNKGSLTLAIYDTAWVSMISKTVEGKPHWLFPECFQFIMDNQLPDGGWESYASEVDGILNTMAALLAMIKHSRMAGDSEAGAAAVLDERISKATAHLATKLREWNVEASLHVGFEILVPALLTVLEQEKVTFTFAGRQTLLALHRKKLEKLDPRILYADNATTFLHSLEAFIGLIDFDKVRHHKIHGSMLASPSSTAAYLMHSSSWDDEAEEYIRNVIANGGGNRSGGVPSVYPCDIFELTWVRNNTTRASGAAQIFPALTVVAGRMHPPTRRIFSQCSRG